MAPKGPPPDKAKAILGARDFLVVISAKCRAAED
jgi:hypothetical protein